MTNIKLVPNKTTEQEIEEIELPTFDIIVHEEDTWFNDAIEQQEEEIRRINKDNSLHH